MIWKCSCGLLNPGMLACRRCGRSQPETPPQPPREPIAFVGPVIPSLHRAYRSRWLELHSYAPAVWDPAAAQAWFARWLRTIPGIGCRACLVHFRQLLERTPPDFSSREAFFRWTVDIHNQVNAHLGRPLFTLEQAIATNCQ